MAHDNTTAPDAATLLTEAGLFGRLLDAPVRERAALSLLIQPGVNEYSLTDTLFGFFESTCFDDFDLSKNFIASLREVEDPAYELDRAIFDIECFLKGLRELQREFADLQNSTIAERPDGHATGEQIDAWDEIRAMRFAKTKPHDAG